jgi:FtsH-binding integral membrane protein
MNSKEFSLTVSFLGIMIALLLGILWIVDYSKLNLPKTLPFGNLRTYGILILIAILACTYFYQKLLLKVESENSALKLTFLSFDIIVVALISYQIIRQNIILDRPFSPQVLISAIVPAILFSLLAASTALSLKKSKSFVRQGIFLALLILVILSKKYIQTFEW